MLKNCSTIILIAAFFLLQMVCVAQDTLYTYFNKGYAQLQTNRLYHCVLPLEDSRYMTSSVIAGPGYYALGITVKNILGEIEFVKILFQEEGYLPLLTLGSSMIQLTDGEFAIVTGIHDQSLSSNSGNCNVIKFDVEGNILWQYEYDHPWSEAGLTITEGANGGILVAGWQQDGTNPSDILLIKIDEQGEEEWVQTYSAGNNCYAGAWSVQSYDNGHFLVSGAINYGQSCTDEYQLFVMRIDEQGEVIWEQNYFNKDYVAKIVLLDNEKIMLTSATIVGNETKIFIAMCDTLGNIEVEKEIEIYDGASISSELQILEDGYVGITQSTRTINNITKRRPLIIRFDENLDTLWTKPITYTDEYDMISRDLELADDGGFIIAGFQLSGAFQLGWLAKVDSLGNTCGGFVEDCDSIVYSIPDGTEHLISEDRIQFSISPNPVRDVAYLDYEIPPLLPYAWWLHIYDTNGVEHRSKRLSTSQTTMELPLPHLKTGIYVYVLRLGDRVLLEGKLVVGDW